MSSGGSWVYKLLFHREVLKDMKKIPPETQLRIKQVLQTLKIAPESIHKKPLKGYDDLFSVRVGDYRIIIEPNHEENIIFVWMISHRGKVYEKLKRRKGE
ncbi:type II toxin-antitoxin system RelE/ParE family toxin [Thermococcus sp. MAR1]|uniref:type II toxin-antitoxin system RelE family toxin n=1 Tax=Thermococcus sp. MAR1 TaxID=1638263 RepID=UPI00169E472C|nr:type II toxin-antitoxin system RelE/ParE family toxin [Thermococcus sp. MAR1]NJE10186.1 type II toxin-antitoxin system RelE/ParE family toxin [Thermococcus sp. MAR1]